MARKKKQNGKANDPGQAAAEAVASGADSNILTDEQRQALFFSHKKKYQAALAAKKEADAALKNVCKAAKAELGDDAVDSIKDAILLETEEGEEKLRARIERQMRVARWMNVPFGAQADLFTDATDPRPATERAFDEGRKAGMEGKSCQPPYDQTVPQHNAWAEGWQAGQAAIFNLQKKQDADVFDAPAELGSAH